MQQSLFTVQQEVKEGIVDLENPEKVHVLLREGWVPQVKKNKAVLRGEILASRPSSGLPDQVSPVAGKVQTIASDLIEIKTDEEDKAINPVDIAGLDRDGLRKQLLAFGVQARDLFRSDLLVINSLELEPGISVHSQLLRDEKKVLIAGLELAKKIICPSSVVFALPAGSQEVLTDDCEPFFVEPVYPKNMNEIVLVNVRKKLGMSKGAVLSLARLYFLGQIAVTGLPCSRIVITAGEKNYRLPLGTPVQNVLDAAKLDYYPGDQILLGGPFGGRALYTPQQGVRRWDMAVTVVHRQDFPEIQDAACLNCGECVLACPVGLMPNMLGRYSEFGLFDQTLKYNISSCVECGMCSYSCTMQRPVLQYIQLAKAELRKVGFSTVS